MSHRILILGGGFGGVYTAVHLERVCRDRPDVEITLVSDINYFLITPFLFEAASGVLDPRHVVTPIRRMIARTRFFEATVERIDLDERAVTIRHAADVPPRTLHYDQLVLALGGITNLNLIPGSEHAMPFKTLADAIHLRNHIIGAFERAEIETDEAERARLLTMVVVGAGLVGVELIGEMSDFVRNVARHYPNVPPELVRFHLIEAGPLVMPEMERDLADYAVRVLAKRGVDVRTGTPVKRIEPRRVYLPDDTIEAHTILLAAGIAVNPLIAGLPLEKDVKGRIVVDATMQCAARPEVWALGDCGSVPDPKGNPYAPLAQHALRQARVLAGNLLAARDGQPRTRFVYEMLGMLASLGHFTGVGRVLRFRFRGFIAWWIWRSYYLAQMPRFDRKLRIVLDWTLALFFRHDIVKLALSGEPHRRDDSTR